MKPPSTGLLAGGVIAMTAVVLMLIGAPHGRKPPPAPSRADVPASSVGSGEFRLSSATIELPADEASFPTGRGSDLVTANCTACHSEAMVLSQPRLSFDQWVAEVDKMRKVYKAPVHEADVDAIVRYLVGMPGQLGAEPIAKAQHPTPRLPIPRS